MSLILLRFALAAWVGGGLAVVLGTRSIFRVASSRREGGLFSGAVLSSFFALRWGAVALTAIAWLIPPVPALWWASAAALLTVAHAP
ncbi:MAG: hypothetical protein ACXWLR_14390, partial [Myxococcales bacterium]